MATGNDEDDKDEPREPFRPESPVLAAFTDDEAAAMAYDDDAVEADVATASGTWATRSLRKSNRSSRSIALRK